MSSSAPTGTQAKKGGLSKYVSRVKSVFKVDTSSKRKSTSAPLPVASTSAPPNPSQPRTSGSQERARALASQFNIELTADDWQARDMSERVEKPIRMRIQRSCHRCHTAFGTSKRCTSCKHVRCDDCTRLPLKERPGNGQSSATGLTAEQAKANADRLYTLSSLTKASRSGGQELVRKKPKQRVRRTCHCCQSTFPVSSKDCASCGHIRCWDCPRDPPKKQNYPNGYPGDASPLPTRPSTPGSPAAPPVSTSRQSRPRYICHECETTFTSGNTKSGHTKCSSCGHEKCTNCRRVPPKKVKPEVDPELLRSVRAKLANMATDDKGVPAPGLSVDENSGGGKGKGKEAVAS